MVPKETTYGTPRWHDMDHASCANIESLRLEQMDCLLFLFSSPVELPSLHIRRICKLRQMVWFDVGVITYDVDLQIDGVLLDTSQKQGKRGQRQNDGGGAFAYALRWYLQGAGGHG